MSRPRDATAGPTLDPENASAILWDAGLRRIDRICRRHHLGVRTLDLLYDTLERATHDAGWVLHLLDAPAGSAEAARRGRYERAVWAAMRRALSGLVDRGLSADEADELVDGVLYLLRGCITPSWERDGAEVLRS